MLKVLDLFSGIGGFSLGLERAGGFKTVAFCEIDLFCRRVLAKHWPDVRQYEDVRELTAERLAADGIAVDVITGGFPCQDISTAGKQAGIGKGTRSGLWSEIVRLARDLRPRFVIVENVSNLLSGPGERPGGWFGRVLGDLAEIGFDAEWHCIPASAVGAPHIRDRIWIVAHPCHDDDARGLASGKAGSQTRLGESQHQGEGQASLWQRLRVELGAGSAVLADADLAGSQGWNGTGLRECADERPVGQGGSPIPNADGEPPRWSAEPRSQCGEWLPEPNVGRVAHGVPQRVDRLRSLGNAVVPQIPEIIGRAILAAEAA